MPLLWAPDPNVYENGELLWGGMINYDPLAQIFKVMLLLSGAITSLMAIADDGVGNKGEFYLIIIIATLGGVMMSSAADLIMVFVALETLSIPLYMLASFKRNNLKSVESGLKYFLYGSFASAIMLYGFQLAIWLCRNNQPRRYCDCDEWWCWRFGCGCDGCPSDGCGRLRLQD